MGRRERNTPEGRSYGLLLRQLVANRAFVLRRVSAELLARGLALVGGWWTGAARLAARVDPRAPEPHRVLAARAEARGEAEAAAEHRAVADRLARNTSEISILTALRNTWAWRRSGAKAGGAGEDVKQLLARGALDEAIRRADESASLGARLDAWLEVARNARGRGELERADSLLARGLALDPGRADLWLEAGRASLEAGDPQAARDRLERSLALDPLPAEAWRALGDACREADPEAALDAWWRALVREPGDDATLARIERAARSDASKESASLAHGGFPGELELGETRELRVRWEGSSPAVLYVVEPLGGGLVCEPFGRVPLGPGESGITLRVQAARPDAVNGDAPWRRELAVPSGSGFARASLEVAVPDRKPGSVHYLITEDHEVYDERETTELPVVRTTMLEKSELAEKIANRAGACWTHMVDVGSLGLLEWAAERSQAWSELRRECEQHLVDGVAAGNDLGLHVHGFHVPGWKGFVHGFDAASGHVTTDGAFLEASIPERGFWSRGFPALGAADEPETRAWVTWGGVARLEALGRLGDPRFRVTLFRAGSLDYGDSAAERERSTQLLRRLEILADSDVPKPRLYHRVVSPTPYPVAGDIRVPCAATAMRLLEIRAEFNIESDFLSDVGVINRYVDLRLEGLRDDSERPRPGVHVICCMTHDKFINWRMGKRWDSLDPDYGDWRTIGDHLAYLTTRYPEIRFSRPRDAVLAWYDYYSPELLAWRDEETIEVSEPGAETQVFRYTLRLLGAGIAVAPHRTHRVRVLPPAWQGDALVEAWIERDGERWPSRRLSVDPSPLEFEVDSRDARFELVVRARAGAGIEMAAEPAAGADGDAGADDSDASQPSDAGTIRLRSALGYRRATVAIPAGLAPDGQGRRVRNVRFEREGEAFVARVPAVDSEGSETHG